MTKCACGQCEGEVSFSTGGEWGSMFATNGTDYVLVFLDPNAIVKMIRELRELLEEMVEDED